MPTQTKDIKMGKLRTVTRDLGIKLITSIMRLTGVNGPGIYEALKASNNNATLHFFQTIGNSIERSAEVA